MNSSNKWLGEIQLIIGAMFSGKSTELRRRLIRYSYANKHCCAIKYSKDKRYTDQEELSTHDELKWQAYPTDRLSDVPKSVYTLCDVIAIDEGQFMPDLVEFAEEQANAGKIVIVAGLDGTYERKGFPEILRLVPLAEHITKLSAVCHTCKRDAAFTRRLAYHSEIEVIGGSDKYEACCRHCFTVPTVPTPIKRCLSDMSHTSSPNKRIRLSSIQEEPETPSRPASTTSSMTCRSPMTHLTLNLSSISETNEEPEHLLSGVPMSPLCL